MEHPTNSEAVRVKRDGPRGWHWAAKFDPSIHTMFDPEPPVIDGVGKKGGIKPRKAGA